jgi:plastocyanin
MRFVARMLAPVCLLAVMACGSKAREPQTHRIAIRAMQFEPASLDVARGDVVVWTNEDIVPHTVTAAGVFDSQSLTNKQEWRYTTANAGEYAYGCTFHPTMKATLTVR